MSLLSMMFPLSARTRSKVADACLTCAASWVTLSSSFPVAAMMAP
jgi:hypothetical protein